jgi:2'-5' RNA ligase
MRLFTAIDPPAEMLDKLRDFLARLRPLAKLRWSAVENLHITTKFIGEWPEARVEEMIAVLGGVQPTGPIQVSVRSAGWFPDLRRPRVFWAGVEAGEPLATLASSTGRAVATLGVPIEARPFSPHLTLARVKDAVPLDALLSEIGNPNFGTFHVSSFFLYLSAGGKYSKLAEFPLNS